MKFIKLLIFTVALYTALSLPLAAQNQVDIEFGNLYNNALPTTVLSGTGTLGEAITGNTYYWVCLDNSQDSPGGTTQTYNVSSDPSVLQAGIWASMDEEARTATIQAATNMFYFYREEILSTTGSSIGYSYQSLVWSVANAYHYFYWNGPLDSDLVALVSSQQAQYFDEEPWLEPLLAAMLITPTGVAPVLFADPADDSTLQSILLFPTSVSPVPEPSSVLLTGAMGLLFLCQRRRKQA